MKKTLLKIFCTIVALLIFAIPCIASSKVEKLYKNYFAFDTVVQISIFDYKNKNDAINCLDEIKEILDDYESIFSSTKEDAECTKLNNSTLKLEDASYDLRKIIATSSEINKLSNGAFDIRIKKSINLWDVKNRTELPEKKDIEKAKKDKSQIDLGAIAKGYVGDKIKEFLLDNEIKSAIVTLGGNVVCIGKKEGKKFNIGIEFPFEEEKLIDAVEVEDKAVVTSGIYQRYFKVKNDNRIYNHIIDPNTGYPVNNELYSVTIIMDNSTLADALSTACMVLGYEKGIKFLDKAKKYYNTDISAVFVDNKYNVIKY